MTLTWQPIATAPRDGKPFLAFDPSLFGICIAQWDRIGWVVDKGSQDGLPYEDQPLSHWMPLPDPPDVSHENPLTSP
jgi:hypothetical protein